MAISLEKFVELTNAEEVGGNIIVGVMADRKIVGTVENGVFNLNEEGQKLAEELEAKKKPEPKAEKPKAE